MKTLDIELEGITPLLMHNPASMLNPQKKTRSGLKEYDPVKEAEESAYRAEDGVLYVPAAAIMGAMIGGAAFQKVGKYSAKSILAGNVAVEPEKISLGKKDYEVDIRTAVISQGKKRNRIIRGRAKVMPWTLNFKIIYNDQYIQDPEIIKVCLENAGYRVGILDFRPACLGNFGTFKINKFSIEE